MNVFGKNLKKFRLEKKLSRFALSQLSKVNYNTIVKIEHVENSNPTLKTMIDLCSALGTNINQMLVE